MGKGRKNAVNPRQIGLLAGKALLMEATASPKPGLVCPDHNGAHSDMEYAHFVASAKALQPYFAACARLGMEFHALPAADMLPPLRLTGMEGERAMFAATGGINTHKGAVFSLGLLCAAYGRLRARGAATDINACCNEASAVVRGIVARELESLRHSPPERKLTAGERIYLEYGSTGARGEAEAAFPGLRAAYAHAGRDNPLCLAVGLPHLLLRLIAEHTDTNILARGGPEALAYAKTQAAIALEAGGMYTAQGKGSVRAMCDEFARRGISPGGSADMLGLVVFFYLLQGSVPICRDTSSDCVFGSGHGR